MRSPSIVMTLVFLTACSSAGGKVRERKEYWQQVLRTEVPVGTQRATLEHWAQGRSIQLTYSTDSATARGPAEYVETNDLVCRGWALSLEFMLSADGKVSSETVETHGNCL